MRLGFLHDRLRGIRVAALATGLLAVAILALGAMSAEGARADAAQVTVVSPGGSQQTISLGALSGQEDVRDRPYAVRSSSGETTQTVTGFSLASILTAAGADPYGFSHLEVQRPAGGAVLLSRNQALDPGAFADGPAVVYATAAGTAFLRPSVGPEDLNASDGFEAPQGITVVLRKDSPLRVRAKASIERTKPGKDVTFTATVEGAGSGEPVEISWYFDDGHSGIGTQTTHSFAKRGSYDVVVGVTTPGDQTGVSAVVTVQVGAPISGPDRKGGGRNEDADAPDHGAAEGSGSGVPTAPSSAPPAEPTPPESDPERAPAKAQPQGEPVSGLLVVDPTASPLTPPATEAARSGRLGEGDGGGGISEGALGLLAALGLLGLGALTETRNLLR